MGEITNISWSTSTFSPWAGCTKVDPLCDNCYAENDTKRYGFVEWGPKAPRRKMSEDYWKQPLKWNKKAQASGEPWRVFCGSWCDVMEAERSVGDGSPLNLWREELYDLIDATPYLTWMLTTKRPQNFRKFLRPAWLNNPRPNVWLLTSIGTVSGYWRWNEMQRVPAVVKAVSAEPLLERIDLIEMAAGGSLPDWLIVGGESQAGARAMHPEWARHLRDQAVANGVAYHFKQFGEHNSDLVHVGKKAAGRELDGRTWDEFPVVTP